MKSVIDPFLSKEVKELLARNQEVLRNLKKLHLKSLTSQLNLLADRKFQLEDGRLVQSGDILKRPLDNWKAGTNMDLYHFCFVYGLGKRSEQLVVDISNGQNIKIKTISEFLSTYSIEDVVLVRKNEETPFEEILKRADSLLFENYSVQNLNCEQFVNYSVFGKYESKGLQNVAKIASTVIDHFADKFDNKLALTEKSKSNKTIRDGIDKLKQVSSNIKALK